MVSVTQVHPADFNPLETITWAFERTMPSVTSTPNVFHEDLLKVELG